MTSAESDAVSGATPLSGTLCYTWNVIDEQGEPVPAGTYRVFLERARTLFGYGSVGRAMRPSCFPWWFIRPERPNAKTA